MNSYERCLQVRNISEKALIEAVIVGAVCNLCLKKITILQIGNYNMFWQL